MKYNPSKAHKLLWNWKLKVWSNLRKLQVVMMTLFDRFNQPSHIFLIIFLHLDIFHSRPPSTQLLSWLDALFFHSNSLSTSAMTSSFSKSFSNCSSSPLSPVLWVWECYVTLLRLWTMTSSELRNRSDVKWRSQLTWQNIIHAEMASQNWSALFFLQ